MRQTVVGIFWEYSLKAEISCLRIIRQLSFEDAVK